MKLFHEHEAYMRPFWEGGTIIGETIWPVRQRAERGPIVITLMNDIARILEVRRADRSEVFTEGTDYLVKDGKLVIPEDSRISVMSWDEYNPAEETPQKFMCTLGGYLMFGESNKLHCLQYEVSYESANNFFENNYRPVKSAQLARTREILARGDELKLAFLGDSITYGCNASGLGDGAMPYMPIYPKLAAEELERRGHKIHYLNPSVGGTVSGWGAQIAPRTLGVFAPDLAVIAFGMNDASGRSPDDKALIDRYIANTKSIIDTVRGENPAAEIILVTTTLPNPIAKQFIGAQEAMEAPMLALAQETNCAVLNMTEIHRALIARKGFHHMTGNNINHPSDFLARVYAQGVLALIGE